MASIAAAPSATASPRVRGSTQDLARTGGVVWGFPARAGIDPPCAKRLVTAPFRTAAEIVVAAAARTEKMP
jgi:hypothetical protein